MTHTQESTTVKSSVHFTLQGKGGVGKSFVSSILSQYFTSVGGTVYSIDTDPINKTLKGYQGLNAEHIKLMNGSKIDERNFDEMMDRMLTQDGIYIVDNGASSFVPLSNYLIENNAIELLQEAGRNVFIHTVITGGQALADTMVGFKSLAEQKQIENIVVWLNEYFGAIEYNGKNFREMNAYTQYQEKVHGIVRIAQRNSDTFGKDMELMVARKQLFSEAIASDGFSIMAKNRLKTMQRDIFSQLNDIGFN